MLPGNLTGLVLDDKYRIERELGRGGMGAVYLATHVGTERPVALKVISPEFTGKEEFVERFRREAKAAGRLRHPNVVDVTDFGFAKVDDESIAYLVMEYLDGCSLADILSEEQSLPLAWVVDILEQVCAAVDEAHKKGIVHRDLKPDNIWLEPNRRGGYTVKVLDFGLAKLAERASPAALAGRYGNVTTNSPTTRVDAGAAKTTHISGENAEPGSEALTQLRQPASEQAEGTTQILQVAAGQASGAMPLAPQSDDQASVATLIAMPPSQGGEAEESVTQIMHDELRTRGHGFDGQQARAAAPATQGASSGPLLTAPADGLTRVGSILGTPLYMSPEQCAGKAIDYRTDIYSLGSIAYQMLSGRPPFTGNSLDVIKQHGEGTPIALRKIRRKIPRQMARTVMSALEKDPEKRMASAAGFASAMRASLDTTGVLLRRGFALFSEHFTPLLKVSLISQLPIIGLGVARLAVATIGYLHGAKKESGAAVGVFSGIQGLTTFFVSPLIIGVTIRLVTQLYVAPLRPIKLRPALAAVKKRFWALIYTTFMVAVGSLLGMLLIIPGILFYINSSLSAPVVVMEGLKGRSAIRRSKQLVKRSRLTVIAILLIQYLIPSLVGSLSITLVVGLLKGLHNEQAGLMPALASFLANVSNIFVIPLIATFAALLYLKTRMVGGEVMKDMLSEFEDQGTPKTRWQMRMRTTVYSPSGRSNG